MEVTDAFEQWLIEQIARAEGSVMPPECALAKALAQYRSMKAKGVIEVGTYIRPHWALPPDLYEEVADADDELLLEVGE